jgi:hypothetical protein
VYLSEVIGPDDGSDDAAVQEISMFSQGRSQVYANVQEAETEDPTNQKLASRADVEVFDHRKR